MILNVDMGNSRIKIACMKEYEIFKKFSIDYINGTLDFKKTLDFVIADLIENKFCNSIKDIESVCVCSVVPNIVQDFYDACKLVLDINPFVVSYDKNIGIELDVDFPEKIGNDRICDCAYAAYKYVYPCLVVDVGTAIVINVLKDNALIGGAILPGLQISVNALTNNAEQLNNVDIKIPNNFVGKNTEDCINLGVVISSAGAINTLLKKVNETYKTEFKLIITGFSSKFIIPFLDSEYEFIENLTLNGIEYIRKLNV